MVNLRYFYQISFFIFNDGVKMSKTTCILREKWIEISEVDEDHLEYILLIESV